MVHVWIILGSTYCKLYYRNNDSISVFSPNGENTVCLDINSLLNVLSSFCKKELGSEYEEHKNSLEITILFESNYPSEKKKTLSNTIEEGSVANCTFEDKNSLITRYLSKKSESVLGKKASILFLHSDNCDLWANLYNLKGLLIDSSIFEKKGKDPRVDMAVSHIYKKVQDYTDCSFDELRPLLYNEVVNFVKDGRNELGTIQLPDCKRNPFLDKQHFNALSPSDGPDFSSNLYSLVSKHDIESYNCAVVLQGFADGNEYFKKSSGAFTPILNEKEEISENDLIKFAARELTQKQSLLNEEVKEVVAEDSSKNTNVTQKEEKSIEPPVIDEPEEDVPLDIKLSANVTEEGGWFSKKKYVILSVTVKGKLPCDCVLVVYDFAKDSIILKRDCALFSDELEQGFTGKWEKKCLMPLGGDNNCKKYSVRLFPSEKSNFKIRDLNVKNITFNNY